MLYYRYVCVYDDMTCSENGCWIVHFTLLTKPADMSCKNPCKTHVKPMKLFTNRTMHFEQQVNMDLFQRK